MRNPLLGLAIGVALAAISTTALAEPMTSKGITFSDELGGFRILALSGSGTLDDPFVLVEEVTGDGGAVLVVRGLNSGFGNKVATQHATGFALHKVVTNNTGQDWLRYEIELREHLAGSSPYEDGLSFGQASAHPPERSDIFADVASVEEPYDALGFADGIVVPGESVTFTMIVTDETPQPTFLIAQHAVQVVSSLGLEGAAPAGYAHAANAIGNGDLSQ
ncbi:MAG: hypothetical protein SGJ07_14785 [Rhodospirillaceae bacterium]|nr:hypothetical protein [Rhodospirillaceae bacterium]